MTKDEIISKIYYDEAGFGSVRQTYLEARAKDSSIKYDDVKKWLHKEVEQKKQLKGYNSFIAKETKEEYQVDLFFLKKSDFPTEEYIGGVLAIDIFSRFITIIPIKSKTIPEILEAIKQIIKKMGKPKSIYSDNEGAWSLGTEIDKHFKQPNINEYDYNSLQDSDQSDWYTKQNFNYGNVTKEQHRLRKFRIMNYYMKKFNCKTVLDVGCSKAPNPFAS